MTHQYKVTRKLQEQSGSYLIALAKIWVDALGLRQSDEMIVKFNGTINIEPSNTETATEPIVEEDYNELRRK